MEHHRVGVARNNPLLIRPELGKSKSRGLSCPGPDFVYGAVTTVRDGGVQEAISNWYTPSVSSAQHRKGPRDFVALNREAVKSGMVTAKELQQYRATHDIRSPIISRRPALPKITQDLTFGVSTRPSTPISELLQYKYAQTWLEEQQAKDSALLKRQPKKVQFRRIQDTRTTLLRKVCPVEEPPSMWKLPRFQQIGSALDTFRDPEARKRAMAVHISDSASRRGLLGQGTHTVD